MSKRRVVVTGLGIVSPVGNSIDAAWTNIVAGKSGIAKVSRFDASGMSTSIAGEVKDFDSSVYMASKEARHFDTFVHYGIAASTDALRDSGLEIDETIAERVGAMVGVRYRRTADDRKNP